MSFCTAINCMDGRVQLPVIKYLRRRFNTEYVDLITEPGPALILAKETNLDVFHSIFARVRISVYNHRSTALAVVAHHDCAGNPAPKEDQLLHLRDAVRRLRVRYPDIEVVALWVDEKWHVNELAEL